MKVIKRNASVVDFEKERIVNAITKAYREAGISDEESYPIASKIAEDIESKDSSVYLTVEQIQDMVVYSLMDYSKEVATLYSEYRTIHKIRRDISSSLVKRYKQMESLVRGADEESRTENSNKDTRIIPTMRDYIAGFTCREIADNILLPEDIADAHKKGIIHYHDSDYSPALPMTNCCLINLKDMLDNGTVISETMIERPHTFSTACTIATQVITQVASSQYGGNTISLAHLSPYVQVTRDTYMEKFPWLTEDNLEELVRYDISKGIQTIQYQLITMSTTNGQAPFTSIFMYLDEVEEGKPRDDLAIVVEEVLRQRIKGVKNKKGIYVTTAFPKLLFVLDEDTIKEDGEYYYLSQLAAECTAKRMVPDYISAKKMRELKEGNVFGCMGCRSFLMPYYLPDGTSKHYGRFNQGVVTLSLPDVALSSGGDIKKFWEIMDERLELCFRALMVRHKSLLGAKSDVAPILWQYGAYARLKPGEKIDSLLYENYSSISLGYAGLYECIKYMTGGSQLDKAGHDFGIEVMRYLYDTCVKWQEETHIGFSLYGSPIESTTYKFAKCLKERFGIIEGITDKNYVTNSYHITPPQEVDAFTKLTVESDFSRFSSGGQISYIEVPNVTKNIDAVIEVMKHIYETNMYAEINTMTSYCHECGCSDIKMVKDESGEIKFVCPGCGNDDFDKMNIALRICGYISTNPFNQGRAEDIYSRVYHLGD